MIKKVSIIIFIFLFGTGAFVCASGTVDDNPGILILAGDGVGYNYFDVRENLQNLGFEPVTIGQSTDINSCYNREEREVPVDLYLNDFNYEDLSAYRALVIPSGGHYKALSYSEKTKELITYAHEQGLIIAAIGTGMSVLASVPGLLQNVNVAENAFFREALISAKAKVGYKKVEYDQLILSGSTGGGKNGSAYRSAPVLEFCKKIAEVIE